MSTRRFTVAQMRLPAVQRLYAKTTVLPNGCWAWNGWKDRDGYARVNLDTHGSRNAHRWVYTMTVGPIPDGYQIDHACHDPQTCRPARGADCPHRSCLNPRHLQALLPRENVLRSSGVAAINAAKVTCKQGHSLSGPNVHVTPAGRRRCLACNRVWASNYRRSISLEPAFGKWSA